jgi:hypothetical protein
LTGLAFEKEKGRDRVIWGVGRGPAKIKRHCCYLLDDEGGNDE